ncbi:MAG TPA: aminotransferase class V-fold PLP-dependent enzyme, partial [Isosphaeraceae bacterium]|nr:aminotransferase class V-fold PLP-dependent enzyme [Isosphaeraceae bacterium]
MGRTIEAARATTAALLEAESQNQIIFTFNGTDSLNLAIHGLLKPGDHVVTSVVEHNSVLRPLRWLEEKRDVGVTRVGCDPSGLIDPDEIRAVLLPETRLIVLLHASNVTGAIQPVAAVAEIAHEHGALFLVDAAQTLGHMPFSVKEIAADLVAAPGHKGLLGPLGTGILYLRPGIENKLACIKQGGTGSVSFEDHQPQSLPEKYESGNHNAPGLIGLGAAVAYLASRGLENVRNHERRLTDRLFAGLSTVPGIINHGPRESTRRIGVLSITLPGTSSLEVARALESTYRVQVRAGYHCAALIHRAIHTFETDGMVRFSIGPFNTESDIDAAIEAVRGVVRDTKGASQQVHVGCRCTAGNRTPEEEVVAAALVVEAPQGSPVALQIPGLDELWAQTLGDPRVCVAVLDGPVDLSHPSLANANLTRVETLVSDVAGGGAATQHGTHVTSIIFGQHDGPVPGIAPGCRGLIIPIYSDESIDSPRPCSQVDLARALLQALQAGANIINVSGGQFSPSGTAHPILADAVRACAQRGALIVAAAGNQGCECLHIPGALPSVLAVGAMNALGEPLPFSNWGTNYLAQGILAPGENILGANPDGRLTAGSGTSFATPIISGIAALLMSLQVKGGQKPDGATVSDALLRSALGCEYQESADCRRLLAGRLNIRGAISILLSGAHSMSDQVR